MGRGHTALVFPQGVLALQNGFHLSRHQSPQPHGYKYSSHSPHLFVQEGLALKLQAPELQPPGNMDASQCDLWLPTLGSKCRPPHAPFTITEPSERETKAR